MRKSHSSKAKHESPRSHVGPRVPSVTSSVTRSKLSIITNKIPDTIAPHEIPKVQIVLRQDRGAHFEHIGRALSLLYSENKNAAGYDCTVICEDKRIPAHRVLLAAHSPVLEKMLYEKGDRVPVDVPMDGIPCGPVQELIGYMYTGNLNISHNNVMEIQDAADALDMQEVNQMCTTFLDSLMADNNLMTTLQLAEQTCNQPLYAAAYEKLAKDFYKQTRSVDFLNWDVEKVVRLLTDDGVDVEKESHVFEAAIHWIRHDDERRRVHFKKLMDCVRWVYMTQEEAMSCLDKEPELLKHKSIRKLLIDANWFSTLERHSVTWKDYNKPSPRTSSKNLTSQSNISKDKEAARDVKSSRIDPHRTHSTRAKS